MRLIPLVPLLAVALGLAGCVGVSMTSSSPAATGNPYPAVPPPQAEQQPKPPVSEDLLVWQMGEWEWVGNGYVWQPGEWVKLGSHSNQFLPAHWELVNGTWTWVRGHWL
jgi:hypothetical protein